MIQITIIIIILKLIYAQSTSTNYYLHIKNKDQ